MRSRNLKPGLYKNPELADAGPIAQLLFAGLWLLADKEGRLKDQPRVIKAELFPYYDVDVNRELTVIERLGNIHRYVTDGIAVIEVRNFKKHQSPHHTERPSTLPKCECKTSCISKNYKNNGDLTVNPPLDDGGNPSDSLFSDSLIPSKSKRKKNKIKKASLLNGNPPQGLNLEVWDQWIDYRHEAGKPIKAASIAAAQRKLASFGALQTSVVENSIANGYQGLFAPKNTHINGKEPSIWE